MDMRQITDTYFVAPQLDPSDMALAAAAGITTIINNRPDAEIPDSHHTPAMQAAAEAAGLAFVILPITHQTMTPEAVATQSEAAQSGGKVLAYCASGTRSTIIWAMGQARSGDLSVDEIVQAAADGGYDLSNMRPQLSQLSQG